MKSGASCNPRHPSMHARRERLQQQPAMTGVAPSARLLAAPRPDGETGHSYCLAPPRVPLVLDLEGPTRTCRAAKRSERNTRTDPDSHSRNNSTWGAPRIRSELLKLGIRISEASVAKYMVRHPKA